jgi:hypothetical protein
VFDDLEKPCYTKKRISAKSHFWQGRMIVGFLNQKGGVGKTTLAIHVADALARRCKRVLLVDADPQGSALDWAAARHGDALFPSPDSPRRPSTGSFRLSPSGMTPL